MEKLYERFNRKVGLQRLSLRFEEALPHVTPVAYTAMAAGAATYFGIAKYIPENLQAPLLGLLAVASIAPAFFRKGNPFNVSKQDALRRLDENMGDKTYPAEMLGSGMAPNASEEERIHRKIYYDNLVTDIQDKLKVSWPKTNISLTNIAGASVLSLGIGAVLPFAIEQAAHILEPEPQEIAAAPEVDVRAWISAPSGIAGAEPVYLSEHNLEETVHQTSVFQVVTLNGQPQVTVNGVPVEVEKTGQDSNGNPTYQFEQVTLTDEQYIIAVEDGPTWNVTVQPDHAPTVTITDAAQPRGFRFDDSGLRISCIARDDFGIAGSRIIMSVPDKHPDAEPLPQAEIPNIAVPPNELCR